MAGSLSATLNFRSFDFLVPSPTHRLVMALFISDLNLRLVYNVFVFVFIILVVWPSPIVSTSNPEESSILLVVGDVTEHTARVLVDSLDPSLVGKQVFVKVFDNDSNRKIDPNEQISFKDELVMTNIPQIWTIAGLKSHQSIRVEVHYDSTSSHAFFTTFKDSLDYAIRFLAISCNRADEDHNDSFMEYVDSVDKDSRDVMVSLLCTALNTVCFLQLSTGDMFS